MTVDEKVELLTQGDLGKALWSLALPAMAMTLGNMLFEIIDMFWVGRTSQAGIAAVAVASYLTWAVKSLANITGGGSHTLIGRSAGARSWDRVGHWFRRGALLALFYSLAVASLGFLSLEPVLRLMELEESVHALAGGYLAVFYLSLPAVFLFVFFDAVFRALGDTLTPAIIAAFSLGLNVLLDPLLIFGWLGFPELGVTGAALASAIAQTMGVILFAWRLRRTGLPLWSGKRRGDGDNDRNEREDAGDGENTFSDFLQISRIGAPLALTGTLFSLIYIFITLIVAQFGMVHIAAMGVGQRWEGLAYFSCLAVSMAVAAIVGQNLGVGNVQRAKDAAYLATKYLLAFTLAVSALFVFFGDFLASILTPDSQVVEATGRYLMIVGFFEVAMALELGLEGAFLGSGDTWPPFFISFPLTLARIPVAWFLSLELGMGIDAVWWTISVSTLLKGILMGVWFHRGKWAQKAVRV